MRCMSHLSPFPSASGVGFTELVLHNQQTLWLIFALVQQFQLPNANTSTHHSMKSANSLTTSQTPRTTVLLPKTVLLAQLSRSPQPKNSAIIFMLFIKIELKSILSTSTLLWYIQSIQFLYSYQILSCIQLLSEFKIVFNSLEMLFNYDSPKNLLECPPPYNQWPTVGTQSYQVWRTASYDYSGDLTLNKALNHIFRTEPQLKSVSQISSS